MLRPVALALLACAIPTLAGAREADPQQHEVRIDLDILVESLANESIFDLQYTFTPAGLNRVDDVVPILRRFVRHPSSLWVRVARNGASDEQVTGARLGGILQLGDGFVYASGEGGVEYDSVGYDPNENGYWAAPFRAEVGVRPIGLLSVGGFWEGRKILGANRDDSLVRLQAMREGGFENRFGATVSTATANDRIYATLAVWLARNSWTFEEFHPGEITARGFGASVRIAFQLNSTVSFQLRGNIRRENWVNGRSNEDTVGVTELEREVITGTGAAEIFYWHKGRYGFRAGVGGGFAGQEPVVNGRDTGIFQLSIGIITRF